MSKFSEKHPKLVAAFNGAVKNPFRPRNMIANAAGTVVATGLCAAFFAVSGAALPAIAGFSAAYAGIFLASEVAYDGMIGAYQAVKAYGKNNPPKPQ